MGLAYLALAHAETSYASYVSYCNFTTMSNGILNESACAKGIHSPHVYSSPPIINNGSLYINVTGSGNPAYQWAFNSTGSRKANIMSCEGDFYQEAIVSDAAFLFDWFSTTGGPTDAYRWFWTAADVFAFEADGTSSAAIPFERYHYKTVVDDNINSGYTTLWNFDRTLFFNSTPSGSFSSSDNTWDLVGFKQNDQGISRQFSFYCYNGTSDPGTQTIAPPVLSAINVPSAGCFNLDIEANEPCLSSDQTPTVDFTTDESAWCRLSTTDQGYTDMTLDCGTGEGTLSHTCTLSGTPLDKGQDSLYVACRDSQNNAHVAPLSLTNTLRFNITGINESAGRTAIMEAVANSLSSYTEQTDQQAYVRTLTNNQTLGNYDKVISSSSTRWLLEYVTGSDARTNAPNLTASVFVWESSNLLSIEIIEQVGGFINNTK